MLHFDFMVEPISVFECGWCICVLKYENVPLVDGTIMHIQSQTYLSSTAHRQLHYQPLLLLHYQEE